MLSPKFRIMFMRLLCRLANHPTEILFCTQHKTGIEMVVMCVCGATYRDLQ